jgi:flagellar hook assembly protein FlgD
VAILDAAGRVVLALPLAAGGATWDGRDASGRSVPAGRYWIRAAGAARGVPLVRLR